MVDFVGGDLPPPPTNPVLDFVMLTLSVTSSPTPTMDPPSGQIVIQLNNSSSVSSLATPVVSNPIPDVIVVHDKQNITKPPTVNMNLKGWKNVLVGNTKTVDPNIVLVYSQIEEGMSLELPDVVLDCILQNVADTLVGKFFSLRPTVEMVRKWVKDKWKLKGIAYVSGMHVALFLFKFTVEEDVTLVLSGC
ncbi:hypothetical protein SUGI_0599220 [Cryptomeria japonica]|nr:hypothetical protein SUGI_0599220 [Cryptomeria japonica]